MTSLSTPLSTKLDEILQNGLEVEFKAWVETLVDRKVSQAFDEQLEFSVATNDLFKTSVHEALSSYVMELDLSMPSKAALLSMIDMRVQEVIALGNYTIPKEAVQAAFQACFDAIKSDLHQAFHGPSSTVITLQQQTEGPAEESVQINSVQFPIAHCQLGPLVSRLAAKVPIWYYGAPGSGKNHMAYQAAQALNLTFYPVYLGPTTTESKLLGYKNAGTGDYVEGLLYEPYMKGGLIFLDEIDVTDPGVLVAINALISNDEYRFPDGNLVKKHAEVHFLAAANTLGMGAMQGFKRNSQDAAARDRWVKLKATYDEAMERKISHKNCPAWGDSWARYVQSVRAFITKESTQMIHITPRASYNGALLLQAGLGAEEVCQETIFAEASTDLITAVKQRVGPYKKSTKLAKE